jgi:hypothetical protein
MLFGMWKGTNESPRRATDTRSNPSANRMQSGRPIPVTWGVKVVAPHRHRARIRR